MDYQAPASRLSGHYHDTSAAAGREPRQSAVRGTIIRVLTHPRVERAH